MSSTAENALERTWDWCVSREWTGMDPYDGLMARRWPVTLLRRSRFGRLALIQGMKRSPVNLRGLLSVPPLKNAKTVALGLDTACRLTAVEAWSARARAEAAELAAELLGMTTPTPNGHGWGYPFDWQSRTFFLAHGVPTVVCTGFVVRALAAARGVLGDEHELAPRIADSMRGAARFVLSDLKRIEGENGFCWSYSPLDETRVVNATLLGAETVARVAALEGDESLLREALPTVSWSLGERQPDGGWIYGHASSQQWEDSFHTGFNLLSFLALREASRQVGRDPETVVPLETLLGSYRHFSSSFFDADGRPWYYRHTPWPIDTHAAAVAILTHLAFRDLDGGAVERARRVLDWSLQHLWLERRGHFRFQIKRRHSIDIPYVRWSQAWMLRALAEWRAVTAAS